MTLLLAGILMAAVILLLRPPGGALGRFRRAVGSVGRVHGSDVGNMPGAATVGRSAPLSLGFLRRRGRRAGQDQGHLSLTLVVQQLAALLKGGRTPGRLWDELWLVHHGLPEAGLRWQEVPEWQPTSVKMSAAGPSGPGLSTGSLLMLGTVRAAAFRGLPVSAAIRKSTASAFLRTDGKERRIWLELAACFDIAEASGCPLADVLARFAAQLEVEDDADAARQTALAGPKATVSLLTWLPVMGLGLGMALGVDPLAVLFGTPLGMAALAAGIALTVAGRIWSARLVHAAAGAAP
jgi:tight adherence protein B